MTKFVCFSGKLFLRGTIRSKGLNLTGESTFLILVFLRGDIRSEGLSLIEFSLLFFYVTKSSHVQ